MYITKQGKKINLSDILLYNVIKDKIVLLAYDEEQLKKFSLTHKLADAPICITDYSPEFEDVIIRGMKKIIKYAINENSIKISYSDKVDVDVAKDNLEIINYISNKQNNNNTKSTKSDFKTRWKKNLSAVLASLMVYSASTKLHEIIDSRDVVNTSVQTSSSDTAVSSIGPHKTTFRDTTTTTGLNTIPFEETEMYITDLSLYTNHGNFVLTAGNTTYEMSEEDKILFASIVASEMGQQYSIDDALAICSVVLNRCEIEDWCIEKGATPLEQITFGSIYQKYEFEAYMNRMHKTYLKSAKTGVWESDIRKDKFELAYKATEDALHGIRNTLRFTEFHAYAGQYNPEYHACVGGNNYYDNPYDRRIKFGNPVVVPLSDGVILSNDGSIMEINRYSRIIPISQGNITNWAVVDFEKNSYYYNNFEDALAEAQIIANNTNKNIDICINNGEKYTKYAMVSPAVLIKR